MSRPATFLHMTSLPFLKLQALGNDFLVVLHPGVSSETDLHELARAMCNRHYGAGSDGLVLLERSAAGARSDFRYRIFNADGGEAEMSGNGIRCAAAALHHLEVWKDPVVRFETLAGVRTVRINSQSGTTYTSEVEMGMPRLGSAEIPMAIDPPRDRVVDFEIVVDGEPVAITATSMGNPHCSIFREDLSRDAFFKLASKIENHHLFPQRTNVELVRVLSRDAIGVTFWERGVGETLSSGTGSCAAMVASRLRGFIDEKVSVHTPAGVLIVEWQPDRELLMSGPAQVVSEGRWLL